MAVPVDDFSIGQVELDRYDLIDKVESFLCKLGKWDISRIAKIIGPLRMENPDRVNTVVCLIFNKAETARNVSSDLAEICSIICKFRVHKDLRRTTFKSSLLTRCREEFAQRFLVERERNRLVLLVEECSNEKKRKRRERYLEQYDIENDVVSKNMIEFIGHLYMKNVLPYVTIFRCLNELLENPNERQLEWACTLLCVIGSKLHEREADLDPVYSTLTSVMYNQDYKISNRLYSIIHNVMHLRKHIWSVDVQKKHLEMDEFNDVLENKPSQINSSVGVPHAPSELELKESGIDQNKQLCEKLVSGTSAHLENVGQRSISRINSRPDELDEFDRHASRIVCRVGSQSFETIARQIQKLKISNIEQVQQVLDDVFNGVSCIGEFYVAYAEMCVELDNYCARKEMHHINFRQLLWDRCRMEFFRESADETDQNALVQHMQSGFGPNPKVYKWNNRLQSIGTIQFIGELFKKHLLPASIMKKCLNKLLETPDKRNLEYVCVLLKVITNGLRNRNGYFDDVFLALPHIADTCGYNLKEEVHLMVNNAIDLERNKWVDLPQEDDTKLMSRIQTKAEYRQLQEQFMNMLLP